MIRAVRASRIPLALRPAVARPPFARYLHQSKSTALVAFDHQDHAAHEHNLHAHASLRPVAVNEGHHHQESMPAGIVNDSGADAHGASASSTQFLTRMSANDLFCFTILSAMTSKQLLPLAIKSMPFVPNFMIKQFVYPIYCGGETFSEVRATGEKLLRRGFSNMMISYSVEDAEGSSTSGLMDSAVSSILGSVDQVLTQHYETAEALYESGEVSTAPSSGYVALKPTGLMTQATEVLRNFNRPEYAEKWQAYLDVCRTICSYAETHGKGKAVIVFDAEKRDIQEGVYEAQRVMMREFNRNGNVVVAGTIQMYLQDSVEQVKTEMELAKRDNYQIAMKLVRGAYIHSEKDRWNTIHKTKEDSDASFNTGTSLMMDSVIEGWKKPHSGPIDGVRPVVGRLIVATHNAESAAYVDQRIKNEAPLGVDLAKDESVVFGQLLGMTEDLGEDLSSRGRKVIKYVPWGPTQETKDYLQRRLEENGDAVREGGWTYFKYGLLEGLRRLTRA